MKKIVISILSVLVVTVVVGVAYAAEVDPDAPIATVQPVVPEDSPLPTPLGEVDNAPPTPPPTPPPIVAPSTSSATPDLSINFDFSAAPTDSVFYSLNGSVVEFKKLPPSLQNLIISNANEDDQNQFRNLRDQPVQEFTSDYKPEKNKPFQGLVDRWNQRPGSFSIERMPRANIPESLRRSPEFKEPPRPWMLKFNLKF